VSEFARVTTAPPPPPLPEIDRATLVATRRDLHQHPELGFEERRTSALVTERLQHLGYAVRTAVGDTGVVAVREAAGRPRARCVLIRADMDALPIEEANDVPYRSRHAGKMHACGHDGHVAIGLEVARRLHAAPLPGTVKFAFQPAEEVSHGAQAMIAAGVLDDPVVDAAFGIHLWNDLPTGTIAVMPGPVMASVDEFEITIEGRGGHAAAPHQTIDPIVIAAHVVTGLQSLVSRRRNPFEEGVVSVTQVNAGRAFNVIPGRAELRGTVRTFGGQLYEDAPRLLEDTVRGIAAAFGATAAVRYRRLSLPLVNDEGMTQLMRGAAADIVGLDRVVTGVRTMGGEDMSLFLAKVPGAFAFVGSAPPGKPGSPHHSPTFDIDEESLVIGAALLSETVVKYLTTTPSVPRG
jgi:amidohydrolase